MPPPEPDRSEVLIVTTVLLTGASGYVGGQLIPLLEKQPVAFTSKLRGYEQKRHIRPGRQGE